MCELLGMGANVPTDICFSFAGLIRRAPFGPATLLDEDLTVDFAAGTTPHDVVSVSVTQPLTRDEPWTFLSPGDYLVFRRGEITRR